MFIFMGVGEWIQAVKSYGSHEKGTRGSGQKNTRQLWSSGLQRAGNVIMRSGTL